MQKIKDLFNKKKGDINFRKAGQGHRLTGSTAQNQSTSGSGASAGRVLKSGEHSSQPQIRRGTGPDENVAKATLARLETKNSSAANKSTLYDIMNEEKQKFNQELKIKEEIEEKMRQEASLKEQKSENPFKKFEEAQLFTCNTLNLSTPEPFNEIIRKVKSSIFDNFPDDAVLRSAMILFNCNRTISQDDTKLKNCLEILMKIINNLMIDDPQQLEKFKRIRKSKIEQKVLSLDGALDFMFAIGFTIDENDPDWLVYVDNESELKTKMSYLKDLLSSPQIIPIELDRQLKIFNGEEDSSKNDDENIEATSADMKEFYKNLEKTREINEMFISKDTKTKLLANNQNLGNFRSIFTKLRFKFSIADEIQIIEAIFYSNEKLGDVKTWFLEQFHEILQEKMIQFKQGLTFLNDETMTLEQLKLSPASTLLVVVN